MRRLTLLFILCSIVICAHSLADKPKYSLKDLKALAASGSWQELLEHAEDLPPNQRNKAWQDLVQAAVLGHAASLSSDRDPLAALLIMDAATKRFPWLAKRQGFMRERAALGLKGFRECYQRRLANCTERLLPFVEADPGNAKLALDAAQLVYAQQFKYLAMPFFALAVAWSKQKAQVCEADNLDLSLFAALNTPKSSKVVEPALAVAEACWKLIHEDLVNHFDRDTSFYRQHTCPLLIKKRVLSAKQAATCKALK